MESVLNRLAPALVALFRVWVGLNLALAHGWGKIRDPAGFLATEAMAKFPAPEVLGWFAILAEFLGGLLLAVGLFTRYAALSIVGTMLGAAFVVHMDDPWRRKELALCYAVMAAFFLIHGPGKLSLEGRTQK